MRAYELACSIPWAITPEWLEAILQIAARDGIGPEALEAKLGRPLENTRAVSVRDGVAVIPVTGPIFRYGNCLEAVSGDVTSTQVLRTDFEAALADATVHSILLDVDSPGGEATSIGELANAVYAARGTKPIVAYVGGQASSAAYWIASAADQIIASPTAILGSIGVVMAYRDTRERDEKAGVKTLEFVSSQSPHKRPDLSTDEGKAQVQSVIDSLAEVFVADVARNRGTDAQTVLAEFGQGGVRVGQAAVAAGMADRLGNFEEVLSQLVGRRARTTGAFATATAALTAREGKEHRPMTVWEKARTALIAAGLLPAVDAAGDEVTPEATEKQQDPAAITTRLVDPELARLRAENERLVTAQQEANNTILQRDAEAFADGEIQAGRAFPAERVALVAQYVHAAQDDAARPWAAAVAVGEAQAKSRVEMLKLQCGARVPHGLTGEGLPAGAHVVTNRATTDPNAPPSEERKQELIALSPLRDLAQKNGRTN